MATRHATDKGRMYDIGGTLVPSVTTVLQTMAKPALVKWAENTAKQAAIAAAADLYVDLVKAPSMSRSAYVTTLEKRMGAARQTERELAKASEIGSQTHALIEWTLRRQLGQTPGVRPATTPPAEWAFMAFEDWAKAVQLEPIRVEETVWSTTYGYAGTMDLLARVNGEVMLIDFKTGKSVYAEAFLQNAAYQVALEEMGHGSVNAGLIVRLPKVDTDPEFEPVPVPPRDELFPAFLHCLHLWHWWSKAEAESKAAWAAKRRATGVAMPSPV